MQAIDRVVAILDCFTLTSPQLGVREIARKIELPSSTTGHHLTFATDIKFTSIERNGECQG